LNSVQDLLSGNNALIFAYGVTNSGKTYSVIGKNDDPGLIPRSINLIFNSIKKHLSETKVNYIKIECTLITNNSQNKKLKPSMHSLITCYENEAEENRDLLTLCPVKKERDQFMIENRRNNLISIIESRACPR
jgi:hypothetical protein